MKKVLIISSSLRSFSNSEILAETFKQGALEAQNEVEMVSLKDKEINYCKGCLACREKGRCIVDDDANAIVEKMKDSDVIVFATPIYYYNMAGQLKTLLDRANPLYFIDYKFKDIYILSACADDEEDANKRLISSIEGWIECFDGVELKGVVNAYGVDGPDSIKGNEALTEAYIMAKEI